MQKLYKYQRFLIVTLVSFCFSLSEILSGNQIIPWSPGLPLGIPVIEPTINVLDFGAKADGTTDDAPAFEAAIQAAAADSSAVLIPSGTYFLNQPIQMTHGVLIKGEGPDKTRLIFGANVRDCIEMVFYGRGEWVPLSQAAQKGDSSVHVSDASAFKAGDIVEIQQDNDSQLMYTIEDWRQSWAENARGQLVKVIQVTDKMLLFDRPLYLGYTLDWNPVIRTNKLLYRAGVENLYIRRGGPEPDGHTIFIKNAAYCWVKNVESDTTMKSHVSFNTAFRCEVRNSVFHHSYNYGGSGHGYGCEFGFHSTDNLVENCIFFHLRHAMMVHVGASGNVFGYNFSTLNKQGEGFTNLNDGWVPTDISLHGHFGNFNLFEGNVVKRIGVADHWGPMGPGNTFFRNIIGHEKNINAEGDEIETTVFIEDGSNHQYFVGNTMTNGTLVIDSDDDTPNTIDTNTLILHGNRFGDGQPEWDTRIADTTLPQSYYLQSKPVFYGNFEWPSIGAGKAAQTIPAWERYKEGIFFSPSLLGSRHHLTPKASYQLRMSEHFTIGIVPKFDGKGILFNIKGQKEAIIPIYSQ